MSKLPIKQRKLNIFEKINLKFYQLRKYGKWYETAPEYIKQDEKIIKKMIKPVLQSKGFYIGFKDEKKFIIEIFKNNAELFDDEDRKKIIERVKRESHDEDIMACIANLTIEEQCEVVDDLEEYNVYPFISLETVKHLINNDKFIEGYLEYCTSDIQVEVMKENKEFILLGSLDAQNIYLNDNPDDFELVSYKVKIDFLSENTQYLSKHLEYVKEMSKEIQIAFAKEDKDNIRFLSKKYQIEIIEEQPYMFGFLSSSMKEEIFNNKENVIVIKKVIDDDFRTIKYLLANCDNYNNVYLKDSDICYEYFKGIGDEINNYTAEQLENIFLKSSIIFARGTLRNYGHGYQDAGYDPSEYTIDIYSNEELQLIQKLLPEQIVELVKIDSNYILPYIEKNNTRRNYDKRIDLESKEYYKRNCKEVFKKLYSDEKLTIYEECIDDIFNAAVEFEDRDVENRENIKDRQTKFPLESLKLLFNEKILNSNDSEIIKEYYDKLLKGEDVKELFRAIIGNAYGEKAVQFLNDREELDVYNINSLETFDERILNNFSPAFVNDLLSYNIVGISSLFNIVKNEDDLKTFKQYYDLLSKVFGENIEIMQKAISEYYYIDELFKNIEFDKLDDIQYANLISCVCGNRNEFEITTIDELEQFDNIANRKLIYEINPRQYKEHNEYLEVLKQKIFSNFFGLNFAGEIELVEGLTEEEQEMINCVNFIYNEKSPQMLQELAKELIKDTNIRNPIVLHTAMSKIREKTRIEPLKERLLLKDDLDNACENLENIGKIRKEQCDNINIYYLTGIDFSEKRVLAHHTMNAYGRDIVTSESQMGMSTVSTYYSSINNENGQYLYTDIETEDLIGINYQDAGTSHVPKVVRASRVWRILFG